MILKSHSAGVAVEKLLEGGYIVYVKGAEYPFETYADACAAYAALTTALGSQTTA